MRNIQSESGFIQNIFLRNSDFILLFVRNKHEFGSFVTHAFGTLLSLLATIRLIIAHQNNFQAVMLLSIYGITTTFLYLSSSIYHATAEHHDEVTIWRKIDHIAIYIMIAGTFTPICIYFLEGPFLTVIIILQWLFVLVGITIKLFYFDIPKKVNVSIYLVQGWMAIFPVLQFWNQLSALTLFWLVSGGIFYTVGAIIYQKGHPNPIPGIFGAHEIFHVLILIGTICHYGAMTQIF